jgi:DNA-binding beta-propeller fold protein YncE
MCRAVVWSIVTVAVAGCGGGSLATPPSPALQGAQAAIPLSGDVETANKPLVYVSDAQADVVNIYPLNGHNQQRIGQITGLRDPLGMTVDEAGNLYVADGYDIRVYSPGKSPSLKLTLTEGGIGPHDVAVSPKNGDVAVANEGTFSGGGGGVSFYRRGATSAYKTVTSPDFPNLLYDAFDDAGDEAGPVSWILSAWRRKIHPWDRNSAPERTLPNFGVS